VANSDVITAFTDEQVSRLTGISVRQLRYWDDTDFFCPEYAWEERGDPFSRIYSYLDLVSLKVVARLRKKVPLQRLRIVKQRLSEFDPTVWRGLKLWVDGDEVAFFHPKTGEPEQVVSGQKIMAISLAETLDELDAGLKEFLKRDDACIGQVAQKRRVMHNRRVVAGTRVPVSAIRAFREAGFTVTEILDEYPTLTQDDVEAALADDEAA
jgi:uncharacterized protein (DUF433 family)